MPLRKRVRLWLLALPPVLVLACGGTAPPPEPVDTIRALCAPSAAVGRQLALLACQDEPCRELVRGLAAMAEAFCPKVPEPVEPQGPVGAGGGPGDAGAVHVAPPPGYGNKVVRYGWPQCTPRCEVAAE